MPSKCSHDAPRAGTAGAVNSARYHHARLNGLSAGIGRLANCPPMGYVVPGIDRRLAPQYGSGYSWFATRAATTVAGTVAGCQAWASKPGRAIASPFAVTFADDSIRQPVEICNGAAAAAAGRTVPPIAATLQSPTPIARTMYTISTAPAAERSATKTSLPMRPLSLN